MAIDVHQGRQTQPSMTSFVGPLASSRYESINRVVQRAVQGQKMPGQTTGSIFLVLSSRSNVVGCCDGGGVMVLQFNIVLVSVQHVHGMVVLVIPCHPIIMVTTPPPRCHPASSWDQALPMCLPVSCKHKPCPCWGTCTHPFSRSWYGDVMQHNRTVHQQLALPTHRMRSKAACVIPFKHPRPIPA